MFEREGELPLGLLGGMESCKYGRTNMEMVISGSIARTFDRCSQINVKVTCNEDEDYLREMSAIK